MSPRPHDLPELPLPDAPQPNAPKRPVSDAMAAPAPPRTPPPASAAPSAPSAPPSPSPKSPVHKRRRVANDDSPSPDSAATTLREAVRAALVEAASPKSRQNRVNAVYASFRQRAIQSQQQQKQNNALPDSASKAACSHGDDHGSAACSARTSCCAPPSAAKPSSSCCGSPARAQPDVREQPPPPEQPQQEQAEPNGQTTEAHCTHGPSNPSPSEEPEDSSQTPKTAAPGVFPGKGASAGCEHYARNCWIKAACCNRYYPCRRCHDEAETHEIDRHATELVACVKCGDMDQPVASHCRSCGVQFARYFCGICKFYDDRPGKDAYHCERCGICRVGKGLGIDNYHCDKCGNCVPIESKDNHPCTERSHDSNCPICTEHLGSSTEQVVFMRCGHSIHVDCLKQHAQTSFKCPICQKCLTDMSEWYRQLDERLAAEVIPPEYVRRRSKVYCHDCEVDSTVPFHFVYHKCASCGGYNTRVLHQFDLPAEGSALRSDMAIRGEASYQPASDTS